MSNEYKDWLADTTKEELAQMFHKSQQDNKIKEQMIDYILSALIAHLQKNILK